jgi:hypothetical protein
MPGSEDTRLSDNSPTHIHKRRFITANHLIASPAIAVMNGYTPWEIAILKSRYHRSDEAHKGYLDRSDVARICVAAGLDGSVAYSDSLFEQLDSNHDFEVTFEEFTLFLSTSRSKEARQLRKHFLATDANITAGAAIGLLAFVKSKIVIGLGAFFADPIRLFREGSVDRTASVRSHSRASQATGFVQAFRMIGILNGIKWLAFPMVLNSLVGVSMFLTYAHARAALASLLHAWRRTQMTEPPRFSEQLFLEMGGGFVAGAVSGTLAMPAQALAASHLEWSVLKRAMSAHTYKYHHRILRAAGSHAAFFGSFYACRTMGSYVLFDYLHFKETTFRSALLTAVAGCGAGAGYRLVSVPMTNWSSIVRHEGPEAWRRLPVNTKGTVLFKGLGRSMLLTMPITGVVFLGYEYALASTTIV